MSAPKLNRKLLLEEPRQIPDGAGGYTRLWAPLGTLWADVRPGTGRERASAGLLTLGSTPLKITVRAAPPDSPQRPCSDQRFREGERVFHILAVVESDASARYLTCFAREEVVA